MPRKEFPVIRLIACLLLPISLSACGPDPTISTSNITSDLRPVLQIEADFDRDEINVTAQIESSLSGNRLRLVYGDYMSIETGSRSYSLYRGERELNYRNRSTIQLNDSEYPRFKLAVNRINEIYDDALDSSITLPDLKSFTIDEANLLTNLDGSLTGRWADSINSSSTRNLSAEARVERCTTTGGNVINDIDPNTSTFSIDPGTRNLTLGAADVNSIVLSQNTSLSFCDFSVQLISTAVSVTADPALSGLDVSATSRSPIVRISIVQPGGGV